MLFTLLPLFQAAHFTLSLQALDSPTGAVYMQIRFLSTEKSIPFDGKNAAHL
jgi:hypothetical protein